MKEMTIQNPAGTSIQILLDPSEKFSHAHPEDIIETLGYIPHFLSDPMTMHLSAKECIDVHYQHGGGWRSFEGFTMDENKALHYPGDPAQYPLAKYMRKNESIYQYRYGWVAIGNDVARVG